MRKYTLILQRKNYRWSCIHTCLLSLKHINSSEGKLEMLMLLYSGLSLAVLSDVLGNAKLCLQPDKTAQHELDSDVHGTLSWQSLGLCAACLPGH